MYDIIQTGAGIKLVKDWTDFAEVLKRGGGDSKNTVVFP
jgi:hypothetical protein